MDEPIEHWTVLEDELERGGQTEAPVDADLPGRRASCRADSPAAILRDISSLVAGQMAL
ncbi:hypothetical protein ACWD9K_38100 [Streptomyces sp. 900116325]